MVRPGDTTSLPPEGPSRKNGGWAFGLDGGWSKKSWMSRSVVPAFTGVIAMKWMVSSRLVKEYVPRCGPTRGATHRSFTVRTVRPPGGPAARRAEPGVRRADAQGAVHVTAAVAAPHGQLRGLRPGLARVD